MQEKHAGSKYKFFKLLSSYFKAIFKEKCKKKNRV